MLKVVKDGVWMELAVVDAIDVPSKPLSLAKAALLEDEDVQLFDF